MAKKSSSSRRWLHEHINDVYVQQAQKQGYRSRAAFKLLELEERDKLLRPGMTVVDLGAAPGSWSQIAANRVGRQGCVVALDILAMEPLPGVIVLEKDFTTDEAVAALEQALQGRVVDLVICDIAPNITGMSSVDQPNAMYLVELALDFALKKLRPGGDFLVKVFQGQGAEEFIKSCRPAFASVVIRKPKASRPRSNEVYVLARRRK
ncbi:MAG: 23S rRNA (uridine(2552)-2'-O)-methyltransferase RlmE [Gammaproteobacteria bacterium]|nr:23S rRNA (uridine(2552)-2'-O)-methyltransferase RlmE [Gammaproteobacteria bacterium]